MPHIRTKAEHLLANMTCYLVHDRRKVAYRFTGNKDSQGCSELKTISTGRSTWVSRNTPVLRLLAEDPYLALN